MSGPTRTPVTARAGVDTPAVVRARLEREADESARDAALRPERALGPDARPLPAPALGARAEDATTVPGIGRPLARTDGGGGREVRVHEGEAAARQAEELGAKAFAYGDHVVLGRGVRPGTPEGDRVIGHELAHTGQQTQPGAASQVQRDPEEPRGIGRQPPAEDFVEMPGETGSEDDHVLFDRNAAELDETDQATLRALISPYAEPVTVHVHGYSSGEGDPAYNLNLSAHRAVAVKRFIQGLLPEGSRVVLYAHGEVSEFGTRQENRRVGVDVIERGTPGLLGGPGPYLTPPFGGGFSLGVDLTLRPPPSFADLMRDALGRGQVPPVVDPRWFEQPPRYFTPIPSVIPSYDRGGPAAAYAQRGVPYSERDARSYELHYDFWAGTYVRWGLSPELAGWLAQLGTDTAASFQLSVEYPTRFEELDRQLGTEPTLVPVFNDAMMRWLFEQFR